MVQGVPSHARLRGPPDRPAPPASPARVCPATRGKDSGPSRRDPQAGQLSHVPPLLRPPPAGSQLRHPDGSGAPRSHRCQHDPDLHPRLEPGPRRRPKPGGPHPRSMTRLPLGRCRASSDPTRQFRRARTGSALRQGSTWRGFARILGFGDQPHRAAIPQRALRHRFSMVPSNSRSANGGHSTSRAGTSLRAQDGDPRGIAFRLGHFPDSESSYSDAALGTCTPLNGPISQGGAL